MNSILEPYSIVIKQQVVWGDMDAFEHINNTVYFRYFEDARIAYFEKIGVRAYTEKTNLGPILARTECDFRLPLKYPEEIYVAGRCKILSAKKFQMNYLVYSESQQSVAAEGQGLLVFYDFNENKSCPIPDVIVEAIENSKNA